MHGLAINSGSNRFTEMDENQSYQKQVTGAFNVAFSSQEDKQMLQFKGETVDTGGVTSPNDLNLDFNVGMGVNSNLKH